MSTVVVSAQLSPSITAPDDAAGPATPAANCIPAGSDGIGGASVVVGIVVLATDVATIAGTVVVGTEVVVGVDSVRVVVGAAVPPEQATHATATGARIMKRCRARIFGA